MYAKLFSRIAQSSLMEEDIETRYCFMMLLAIADSGGDVIGTDVALARTVNLPLDTFKRCIAALMAPDPDSNSQVNEGRRIMPSESGRGYLLVNYATYRSIKTAEEKKAYMREYMQRRRKLLKDKDVTAVNVCKTALSDVTHAEGEGEADGEEEPFQPKNKPQALLGDAKSNATSIRTEKKPEYCESFLTFWTAYPRREGKGKAEESWKKMGCTAILAQILKAVEAAKTTEQWKKDNGQFIPMPATWLNQKRWEDEPATAPAKPAASYYLPGVGMVNAK